MSEAQRDAILRQDALKSDELLEITIQLPAQVCWWDQPQVVRWQIWEESAEFKALRKDIQHYNLHFEEIELEKSMRLFNRIIKREDIGVEKEVIEDFDLTQRTEDIRLFYILTKYIVPKLSLTYRFECELREEEEKLESELKRREHIKREFEEDQRVLQEAKQAKKLKRALAAKQEDNEVRRASLETEQTVDKEQPSITSQEHQNQHRLSSQSNDDSDMSISRPQSLVEFVEAKRIVQGSAARPFFPIPLRDDHERKLQIEPPIHRPNVDSIMLSQLINSIEMYNRNEEPIFKDTVSVVEVVPESLRSPSRTSFTGSAEINMKKERRKTESAIMSGSSLPLMGTPQEPKGLYLKGYIDVYC